MTAEEYTRNIVNYLLGEHLPDDSRAFQNVLRVVLKIQLEERERCAVVDVPYPGHKDARAAEYRWFSRGVNAYRTAIRAPGETP